MKVHLLQGPFYLRSVIPLSFTKPGSRPEPCSIHSTVSKGNPQKGLRKGGTSPLALCVYTSSFHTAAGQALHCIQCGWTKDRRNRYCDTSCLSSNKVIRRGRNKKAGYISRLKEKNHFSPCQLHSRELPVFPRTATLNDYPPTLSSSFCPNHRSNLPSYSVTPQKDPRFWAPEKPTAGRSRQRLLGLYLMHMEQNLSSTVLWAHHHKPCSWQRNKTFTRLH